MPSNRVPTTTIATGVGPLPPGGFGGGSGSSAALTNHINDPVDAHDASAISTAGSPNWADGTTNPPANVEVQFDKIITDLTTGNGAGKILYNGSAATFADATGLAADTLDNALDSLVTFLGSIGTPDGSTKIGTRTIAGTTVVIPSGTLRSVLLALSDASGIQYESGSNFPNAGPVPDAAVDDTIDFIVQTLSSQVLNNSGAHNIGTFARLAWADGTTNPADELFDALEKIITDLGSTAVNLSGAQKIGIDARPSWLDTLANPATNVATAIDKIITDLSDQTGVGFNGASRIGFAPQGNLASNNVEDALAELDTEKGGLSLLNTWLNNNFFEIGIRIGEGMQLGAINANTARLEVFRHDQQAAATRSHIAHFRRSTGEAGGTDIYNFSLWREKGNGAGVDRFQLTSNATYNNSTALWSHEQNNNPSFRYDFQDAQIELGYRASGAGTWADASWITKYTWDVVNGYYGMKDGQILWSNTTTGAINANPPQSSPIQNRVTAKNVVKSWGRVVVSAASVTVASDQGFNVDASGSNTSTSVSVTFAQNTNSTPCLVVGGLEGVAENNVQVQVLSTAGFTVQIYDDTGAIVDPQTAAGFEIHFIMMAEMDS